METVENNGNAVRQRPPAGQPTYQMVGGRLIIRFPDREGMPRVRLHGQTYRADEDPSVTVGGKKMPVERLV